jgi:hypothetical protein
MPEDSTPMQLGPRPMELDLRPPIGRVPDSFQEASNGASLLGVLLHLKYRKN